MAYEVILDKFSGPLDLLLHLIQKNEINIHDIPIATITSQYLEYLRAMEELSLDIASEFVVMAATLLALKSRMLLPKPPAIETSDESEVDPREQLVQQLIEYQRCKWAAELLKEKGLLQSQVYARHPADLREYIPKEPPPVTGVTMWDLVDAYRHLLKRVPKTERVARIEGHVLSVEDEMGRIALRLKQFGRALFGDLFQGLRTRPEVVVAFLALLELVKLGNAKCTQILPLGDIEVVWSEEAAQ